MLLIDNSAGIAFEMSCTHLWGDLLTRESTSMD